MSVYVGLSFDNLVDKLFHFSHNSKCRGYMFLALLIIGASVVGIQFTAFQKQLLGKENSWKAEESALVSLSQDLDIVDLSAYN